MKKIILLGLMIFMSIMSFSNLSNEELIINLKNSEYKLVEVTGYDLSSLNSEVRDRLIMKENDGRVNIFLGVNQLNVGINKKGKLFTSGMMTLMAGEEKLMKLESKLFEFIDVTSSYKIEDNKIIFYNNDKTKRLVYERIGKSLLESTLENSVYKLKSFSTVRLSTLVKETRDNLTIQGKDGKLEGFGGVNRFVVSYSKDKFLNEIITTRMAGSPEALKFESEYIKALSGIKSVKVKGNKLTLETTNGTLVYQK